MTKELEISFSAKLKNVHLEFVLSRLRIAIFLLSIPQTKCYAIFAFYRSRSWAAIANARSSMKVFTLLIIVWVSK